MTASELRGVLKLHDLTMEELVQTADTLIGKLAPQQTRYKVTERPDARTIRYYVQQELLPKPQGYDGGRARYGGSHLLRLLFIKRLQAEHNTLSRIARLLDSATDDEVIEALAQPDVLSPNRYAAPARARERGRAPLAIGGPMTIPDDVLRDPVKRKKLAESLEHVARWLRET